eukprot:6213057-Pleurochrysis_carterae.AAC.2
MNVRNETALKMFMTYNLGTGHRQGLGMRTKQRATAEGFFQLLFARAVQSSDQSTMLAVDALAIQLCTIVST